MRIRFSGRFPALPSICAFVLPAVRRASGVLAVCMAVALFPGIAAAIGTTTATPTQPSLAFNPAPVGVVPALAQTITADFIVTGTDTLSISQHYGSDFTADAMTCSPRPGGQTCLVPITFIPTLPGARKDALFLLDGTTVIATIYLGGVGQSPLALLQPGVVTQLISASPTELSPIAVDEIGTVYLQNETSTGGQILSVTQGGNTPNVVTTLPIQVVAPQFGAIDGAGMLYISNANPNTIEDLITWNTVNETQGSITISPPAPYVPCFTTEYLTGVAADPKGDLFIIEADCQQLFERVPGGVYATRAILPQINGDFFWLAVDGSGNAFAGSADQINELLANKTQSQLTNFGDPSSSGLAVDAADSLYVKLGGAGGIVELPATNYQTSEGLLDPPGSNSFVLGSDGSLYIGHAGTNAGAGNGNLDKVDRSKGAINFGQQTLGTLSPVEIVQLYNGGNQALTLYNVSLGGAGYGYAIQSSGGTNCVNGLVIAPGELCELAITLTALQGGTLDGTVFFSTNSVNNENSTSTVTLTASVPGPFATLTPNPLAFGNQIVGTTSAKASFTLSNTSSYPLEDIVISRLGANASEFAIVPASNACGSSLPALSSCFIYVTFTPQAAGPRTATFSVADNATNSPQTANLTGTGQGLAPAVINIAEVIHTTDVDVPTPSMLLNIAEVIHTTDADLLTPSMLLNIAEMIHTADAPVLTAPPPQLSTTVTASGLAYSRVSQTYVGAVTITNTGAVGIQMPVQLLFTGLTPNVTLVNATGTNSGTPYITVSAPAILAAGKSVVVNVQFKDPSNAPIHFTPQVQEGSI